LRRWCCCLREILLEQRLKGQNDNERQDENEKKPAFGARFLVRILKVSQSLRFP